MKGMDEPDLKLRAEPKRRATVLGYPDALLALNDDGVDHNKATYSRGFA
jgi:hypothetical protein